MMLWQLLIVSHENLNKMLADAISKIQNMGGWLPRAAWYTKAFPPLADHPESLGIMTDESKTCSGHLKFVPDTESLYRYQTLIDRAIHLCADSFLKNPKRWSEIARRIAELNQAWETEYEQLNPPQTLTYQDPESGTWYPDKTKKVKPQKEPSQFNPIRVCCGKPGQQKRPMTGRIERISRFTLPTTSEDARLVYYTLIVGLHDGTALIRGFPKALSTPDESLASWFQWLVKAAYCPEMMDDDRADFLETAIRFVQADIETAYTETKAQQTPEDTSTPSDLIDLAKAIEMVGRSRSQLKRDIKKQLIVDYRKNKRSKHIISEQAVRNKYLKR